MLGGTILLLSYDRALLRTRALLLRSEGYDVRTVDSTADAAEVCRTTSLDLVIIGHSIPCNDRAEVSAMVRQACPAVPILLILRSELEGTPNGFEYKVNAQDGPGVLLHTVNSILRRGQKKHYG